LTEIILESSWEFGGKISWYLRPRTELRELLGPWRAWAVVESSNGNGKCYLLIVPWGGELRTNWSRSESGVLDWERDFGGLCHFLLPEQYCPVLRKFSS